MKIFEWMRANLLLDQVVGSVVLVLALIVVRILVIRRLKRHEGIAPDLRRRSIVQARNASFVALLLGLLIIWASQIQGFALSIVAIAAAIVIATKELLMCFTGTLVKSRSFTVGDRIEVGSVRGDVIDQTLLTTTLLEVGPGQITHQHTGRAVVLPNSVFLSQPVINETYTDEYVLHVFVVPVSTTADWQTSRQRLLEAASRECSPFLEEARKHMERLGQDQGFATPSVEPRVTIQFVEPDRIDLTVRIPALARTKGRLEQAILNRYSEGMVESPPPA